MTIHEKIVKIQDDLGIKSEIMAKFMGVTLQAYKNKKSLKSNADKFNEDNYTALIKKLKHYIKKL